MNCMFALIIITSPLSAALVQLEASLTLLATDDTAYHTMRAAYQNLTHAISNTISFLPPDDIAKQIQSAYQKFNTTLTIQTQQEWIQLFYSSINLMKKLLTNDIENQTLFNTVATSPAFLPNQDTLKPINTEISSHIMHLKESFLKFISEPLPSKKPLPTPSPAPRQPIHYSEREEEALEEYLHTINAITNIHQIARLPVLAMLTQGVSGPRFEEALAKFKAMAQEVIDKIPIPLDEWKKLAGEADISFFKFYQGTLGEFMQAMINYKHQLSEKIAHNASIAIDGFDTKLHAALVQWLELLTLYKGERLAASIKQARQELADTLQELPPMQKKILDEWDTNFPVPK